MENIDRTMKTTRTRVQMETIGQEQHNIDNNNDDDDDDDDDGFLPLIENEMHACFEIAIMTHLKRVQRESV